MPRPDFVTEAKYLQQVVDQRPEPCIVKFGDWNSAVSMKARLTRLIRYSHDYFRAIDPLYNKSPYSGLTITVLKPGTLLFRWELSGPNDPGPTPP
jgi:hypothetical protein